MGSRQAHRSLIKLLTDPRVHLLVRCMQTHVNHTDCLALGEGKSTKLPSGRLKRSDSLSLMDEIEVTDAGHRLVRRRYGMYMNNPG